MTEDAFLDPIKIEADAARAVIEDAYELHRLAASGSPHPSLNLSETNRDRLGRAAVILEKSGHARLAKITPATQIPKEAVERTPSAQVLHYSIVAAIVRALEVQLGEYMTVDHDWLTTVVIGDAFNLNVDKVASAVAAALPDRG